jgi:hypothetical protein
MLLESDPPGSLDWRAITRAGIAYTLGVFLVAFAVGAIRVTLVAPRVGALLAVAMEAPVVLSAAWLISRRCIRRFAVLRDSRSRILMGGVAFTALMVLEVTIATLTFGQALDDYVAKFATAPGLLGLAVQMGFATLPLIQGQMGPGSRR